MIQRVIDTTFMPYMQMLQTSQYKATVTCKIQVENMKDIWYKYIYVPMGTHTNVFRCVENTCIIKLNIMVEIKQQQKTGVACMSALPRAAWFEYISRLKQIHYISIGILLTLKRAKSNKHRTDICSTPCRKMVYNTCSSYLVIIKTRFCLR